MLQQYLPFTVLKPSNSMPRRGEIFFEGLQQYLPFTVLKLQQWLWHFFLFHSVATVPTVYGIETNVQMKHLERDFHAVATVPTVYGIETFHARYNLDFLSL